MRSGGARKVPRFLLVGGAAALGYLGVATLLRRLGLPVLLAGSFAFLAMMPFSYAGHRLFTFGSERGVLREFPKFVISSVFGVALSGVIPYLTVSFLQLSATAGFAFTCVAVPTLSYLLLNGWVFTARD
jgi:putative flippase GtrA